MNAQIKNNFPFFKQNNNISYLDSAASSLKLSAVIDSLNNYYINNGTNIHRGVYKLAYDATNDFEETRKEVANFINCNTEEVIFTKSTTDALNKLANSLSEFINDGDEIITSELEHHSQFIPWQEIAKKKNAKIVFVPLTKEGRIEVNNFKKVLSDKTKIVALTYVSNVLGYETPISEIADLAHEKNAILITDAAQAASHTKIDVKALKTDFLAFSGHKMYGPNGVGVLYGKKELLNKIKPLEYGGEMAHIVNKEQSTWKELPWKHEAGTPVIAEVIAFKEAIKFINKITIEKIYEHSMKLKNYTLNKLKQIDDIIIYNESAENPIITFNLKNIHPHDVASILDQKNVYIRAGHHCAQLVAQFLNVTSTLRASFNIYNTYEDCDKLVEGIKVAKEFFDNFG